MISGILSVKGKDYYEMGKNFQGLNRLGFGLPKQDIAFALPKQDIPFAYINVFELIRGIIGK